MFDRIDKEPSDHLEEIIFSDSDITERIDFMKNCINLDGFLGKEHNIYSGGYFSKLKNDYEFEIFSLLNKIKHLEKKEETLYINKKDLYIVGYFKKKGSECGGGARVRAINIDEAIEEAKMIYPKYANDKNYIYEARPLNTFSSELFFTILNTTDEFDYQDKEEFLSILSFIQKSLDSSNYEKFKITIEGKPKKQ